MNAITKTKPATKVTSGGTLEHAFRQWSTRPADEKFSSLIDLHSDAVAGMQSAAVSEVKDADLHVIEKDGTVMLNGKSGQPALMTNWSFGQVCREAKAPSGYLATLPAKLAVECINQGFKDNPADDESDSMLLFDRGGPLTLRSLSSTSYSRIWDADVTKRLLALERGEGTDGTMWQPAPAAFDGSRGLYRGDRDMFCFLVDNGRRIFEKDKNGGLSRGFFTWNSEVGGASYGIMSFLYEHVCGNHRVWGAQDVSEFRIRHIGNADEKGFAQFTAMLTKYANSSAADDEAKILAARQFTFGATKDQVLDKLFGLKIADLTQTVIAEGYAKAVEHEDWYGNPRSAWGISGGITEVARDLPNADQRVRVDRAARKIMEMAF